jgi:hypothetical protein
MKPQKPFLKIAVLTFFILFLAGFVAYRSGAFDKWLNNETAAVQSENNNRTDITITIDSAGRKVVSTNGFYIDPSEVNSNEPRSFSLPDTPKYKTKKSAVSDSARKVIMMSGSKSGVMIPIDAAPIDEKIMSTEFKSLVSDSTTRLTSGNKPVIHRTDTPVIKADTPKPKRMMYSTKSAPVIRPRK